VPAAAEKSSRKQRARRTVAIAVKKRPTLWDRIGHLAGSIDGPGNLSALSKTMPGYGRSRSR
jgi:hypothetical protein